MKNYLIEERIYNELRFSALSEQNEIRCESGFNHNVEDWTMADWALAISGEWGEACNFMKKLKRIEDGIEPNKDLTENECLENIGKELADAVIYIDLLAQRLGLSLGYEVVKKFNETSDKIKSNIKLP